MAIDLTALKQQSNIVDDVDDMLLQRQLDAARLHVERLLGYSLDDSDRLPDGAPGDLEHAVLLLAAHWYENREAVMVGLSAQELPLGVKQILAEYRSYTFG